MDDQDRVVAFRHYFHQNPEPSTRELNTQHFIVEQLKLYEISYTLCTTGVIAYVGYGNRAIALRADMDALPIEEESCIEFRSKISGWMHACGHDMHMAMLLETALRLKEMESQLEGKIYLVFQPSEEKRPGGARLLLPYLKGKVEAIFGQHIAPEFTSGTIASRGGAFFASSDNIRFTIEGSGTHAATPHKGADPILASAMIIQYLQTVVTKFRDPLVPAVLTITSIHGGNANNIVPDRVELLGTVRCHDNSLRDRIFRHIEEGATALAALYGCRFVSQMEPNGLPVLVNDEILYQRFMLWAKETEQVEKVLESKQVMLGEDFAIYAKEIPACFWRLGVSLSEQILPPLHNPKLVPPDEALGIGVAILMKIATSYFK